MRFFAFVRIASIFQNSIARQKNILKANKTRRKDNDEMYTL